MNWTENISVLTVFLQGAAQLFPPACCPFAAVHRLSFRRCADGRGGRHSRISAGKVLTNTLSLSWASAGPFLLGLGCHYYGRVFSGHRVALTRLSGAIVLVFGLFQLGVFRSLHPEPGAEAALRLDQLAMNPLTALVMGFTFSFLGHLV